MRRINKTVILLVIIVAILLTPLIFYGSVVFFYRNKIIPRVKVSDQEVSGFKKHQVENLLRQNIIVPDNLIITSNGEEFKIPLSEINFKYDYDRTYSEAFKLFRNENYYTTSFSIIKSFIIPSQLQLFYDYNNLTLDEYLSVISAKVSIDPIYPSIKINGDKIEVTKGSIGRDLDIKQLRTTINESFANHNFKTITAVENKIDPTLNSTEEANFLNRAEKLKGKNIKMQFESFTKNLDVSEIYLLVSPYGGYNREEIEGLVEKLKPEVEREPQNSVFSFKEGRVVEFVPSKEGITIKRDQLYEDLKKALMDLENTNNEVTVQIPVNRVAAEITNNEVNDLGINELIGRGESFFRGSIPGRVHNVGLAASRINGSLIKPGDIYSFNLSVGDVSVLTGYKQAYIIQDGKTILGDGGGVCQVSTTLFRAVLNAGLPIVERSPHSYRVSYYEQNSGPGLDATVFSPTTDFKFKNDTPATILIQTLFDPKLLKLVVEIYGTSDGRVSQVSKPVITSTTPPPDDLYTDDPNLPVGTVKQIDYKAWGAKVIFDYTVTRNGETIQQKKFVSNYKPWQAKFLRGTAPN